MAKSTTKFTTVDLKHLFNATRRNRPLGKKRTKPWPKNAEPLLTNLPANRKVFWGIPFRLGPPGAAGRCMILLPRGQRQEIEIPLRKKGHYLCLGHVDEITGHDIARRVGQHLADYVLRFADGSEHVAPVRHRFEINGMDWPWAAGAFASVPATMPRRFTPQDAKTVKWGLAQTGVHDDHALPWIYALQNPKPDQPVHSLVIRPTGRICFAIMGLTLYNGPGHPLRHVPRNLYRLVLPTDRQLTARQIAASLDMGNITALYAVPGLNEKRWLAATDAGLGSQPTDPKPTSQFLVEATGAVGATLTVKAGKKRYQLPFGQAVHTGQASSDDKKARLEVLYPHKTWLYVNVVDSSTRQPTPVRVHFRGRHGQYLPPYGHPAQINPNWFEDVGGDLLLGNTSYAYVPGRFQTELPVGDVYVEISKGFEHRPLRKKITIKPGQRELNLTIDRWTDMRRQGWRTADTHVHFISSQTALLEAQCEGLNLVNLLASQWGKLFTNVSDISGDLSGVSTDETLVWVGTENRHHIMGHISMLGVCGDPVFPMCAGGPGEADLGDPDYMSIAEWADTCRARDGLVIHPHFPYPLMENAADLVLGKIDAVEIRDFSNPSPRGGIDTFAMREWYRYLNCGYRITAVGGTDKMSSGMPVGGVRTYARLNPDQPFNFPNWAQAVRAGRTFTTSGPLIDLTIDGHPIGSEIHFGSGGGTIECVATVRSAHPVHCLELVVNGRVAARTTDKKGRLELNIHKHLPLPGSAWIAARTFSRHKVWHCWPVHLAAHTSPIYVIAAGRELFSPSDATYMLTLLDGGLTWADTLSIRYDAKRHAALRSVFEHAQTHLQGRAHHHQQHG